MLKKNVVRGCLGIGAFTIMALCLLVIFYFWTSIKAMYTHRMMTRDEIKKERERLGIDNYREEGWCPVCGRDSVVELKYGFGIGSCLVSSDSKRFACKKCDYSLGRLPHYQKHGERAFNEKTICEDKEYSLDVDFDKAPDIVCVKNGNVRVYRLNPEIMKYQKVSNQGRRTIWYWFNPGDNLPPS